MIGRLSLAGLAAICVLNVNGAVYMWTGGTRRASLLLLLCLLGTLLRSRGRWNRWSLAYAGAVLIFVTLATAFALMFRDVLTVALIVGPIGSAAIVIATASAGSQMSRERLERVVAGTAGLCGLAAVAVLASPWLYQRFVNPPEDITRLGGVFGNPNEAAVVCAVGLALALHRHASGGGARYLILCLVLIAGAAATLSKAGMLAVGAIVVFALAGGARLRKSAGAVIALVGILFVAAGAAGFVAILLEGRALERASELGRLLLFQIDEETSTNRTVVWKAALEQIGDRGILLGSGLGAMRAIVDGLFENGSWRGAHNWWLMILGEAGVIALISMLTFFVGLALRAWRSHGMRLVSVGYLLAFSIDTLSSHNLFELRFHAFLLGLCIAASQADQASEVSAIGSSTDVPQ